MDNIELRKITARLSRVVAYGINAGTIRRVVIQVPARNVYFPCTTDKVQWIARDFNGEYVGQFDTRKQAAAILAEGI